MRPPGAWITDAINFTYDIDVYAEWANMVVNGSVGGPFEGKYFTAYASRKDHLRYRHDHRAVLAAHGDKILQHNPIENIFSRAMGNYAYQMRSTDPAELREACASSTKKRPEDACFLSQARQPSSRAADGAQALRPCRPAGHRVSDVARPLLPI